MKNNKINIPYCSNAAIYFSADFGKKAKRTFEPSSGGIGTRLKTPRATFIKITMFMKNKNAGEANPKNAKIFKIKLKIIAIEKLLNGPDKPINPLSLLGFFKYKGLNGTGFAQPNKTGLLIKKRVNGKRNEPKKSRCFIGFKVSRPAFLAVGSPKR